MKIVIAAAFVLATVGIQPAFACDWNQLHAAADRTVVACDGNGCHPIATPPAEQAAADSTTSAPQVAEPASPAPTIMAQGAR
jgi:hypothetical protein